ncbi:MAG: SulP family inorganic anion transporter [Desulfosalsimonadaceae bacterium]
MVSKFFPFLLWFKGYDLEALRIDALSGLTVALVLIPQSMAYAQLAGLPSYYGLYASFLPPMIAALFGSSRQLATGPVAVVSLMTSVSLAPLATAGSEAYIAYAILLAFMVGVFQFSLGVLRLGLVVNFLSHPVVNGFTNAVAIVIATSQLSKIFGVHVDSEEHHYDTVIHVLESAAHYTHWPTVLMAVLAFAIMFGLKRISPRIPSVLLAATITILLSWALDFEHNTRVSLSEIEAPQAHDLIEAYNDIVNDIPGLAAERTALNSKLEQARKDKRRIRTLDMEHDLNVINIQIERLEHRAMELRSKLRDMLFAGVERPDGTMVFYPQEQVPEGAETDGRTWRISVKNDSLDTDSLLMIGGGEVVGVVPQGLPSFSVPPINFGVLMQLLPFAAIISILGFMEAISIAKAMAAKTGQQLDPNQELIGQGLGNILGSIGKSYPTSGSFSRSALNLQAGARTGLASVFTSLMVVIVLLFFTPLLYHLPQAVLAAAIMMAVIGLVNVSGFIHAWRAKWYDGAISIIAFAATLAYAPHLEKGILLGVVLSLLVFLYKSMRPKIASLSMSEDACLKDALYHGLRQCDIMDMIRFDGPLFFANASYLEEQINQRIRVKKKMRHILIVSNGISDIDASGEEALSLIIDRVRSAGIDISFSGVNESVMEVFMRTHLLEKIGTDHIFSTEHIAFFAIHDGVHSEAEKASCPLSTVCYSD